MGAMGPKTPHTSSQMADEKLSKAPQEAPVVVEKKLVNKERILGTIDMVEEWQLLPFVKTGMFSDEIMRYNAIFQFSRP